MIKRTVGLRPIKYSKLPTNVQVALFNAKTCEKKAIEESFIKFSKNGFIKDESDMWKDWNEGKDASELDYVLLFSNIPHNALKDIWYITRCDKIMKFASFNRIYNQCVCGDDILWVNCNEVEHIQQKIRWDKLIIKSKGDNENDIEDVTCVVENQVCFTENVVETTENTEKTITEDSEQNQTESNSVRDSPKTDYSIVNVIDNVTDNEIRTWVYNLPKKVVSIDENASQNLGDENGPCVIL